MRSSKYLNNMIEQDHRRIKQRTRPMLGFKRFGNAAVTISGIELLQKIQKHQFKTGKLGGCLATMEERWNAVLAVESPARMESLVWRRMDSVISATGALVAAVKSTGNIHISACLPGLTERFMERERTWTQA